jgi:DNA-directed RNA polymerase subunit M/transcription elongation factor TFIIS
MPRYCPRCGETLHTHSTTKGEVRETARRAYEKPEKTKRAPSAYNKRYSAEYKRQAKKHPRLKFAALSKRTHKALRRK